MIELCGIMAARNVLWNMFKNVWVELYEKGVVVLCCVLFAQILII